MLTKKRRIEEIWLRTIRNCNFYLREGKEKHLHNEIGVLRGIYYAAKELNIDLEFPEDLRKIQLKYNESEGI